MRVLFTSFPALGHIHPMAPLALAARDAGHDVVVATGPDLIDWVVACGLRGVPAGLTQEEAIRRAAARVPAGAPAAPTMFTLVAPPAMLDDLDRLTDEWRPDVVVHEESEYAGPALAARIGIGCATHSWNAPAKAGATRRNAAAAVSPLWDGVRGIAPRVTGEVYLDACPPMLQSGDLADVGRVVAVRPVPFDGPARQSGPPPDLRGKPLVYVTFGTVPEFADPQRLATVVRAVGSVAGAVVVTSGPNEVGALGSFGDHVRVERYLPQSVILPRADLVVSHGGAGTTLGALVAGLGHVVLPQGGPSQHRNAEQIRKLGLGVSLEAPDQTADRIAEAVTQVLADDRYARAAGRVRAQLAAIPGPAEIVDVLTALGAASRR